MKTLAVGLGLVLLAGCTTIQATREELVQKMPALREVESESQYVAMLLGISLQRGELTERQKEAAQMHYDLYYVYHKAAIWDAVKGSWTFQSNVDSAKRELESIQRIVKGPGI